MKEINVKHLARVEGDGGITVEIDGDQVKKVNVDIFEGPRLIEALAEGKNPMEAASFTPRICAICTVSHKNASIRASERAVKFEEPKKTYYTRELMHMGEMVESHSLHVFALALPDFLDGGYPNVIAMVPKYGDIVKQALALKKFGNRMMQVLNGKFIHGENATPGGFGRFPSKEELIEFKNTALNFIEFMCTATDIFAGIPMPAHLERDTEYWACNMKDYDGKERFGFWGDELICTDGTIIPSEDYNKHLIERVVPHSMAKRSLYKERPFSVGALARLLTIGERLTGKALEYYKKYVKPEWKKNIIFNNHAQAVEIIFCLERIPELVDILLAMPEDPAMTKPTRTEGRGVGAVEAPRGLLIHDYTYANGLIAKANIITPTAFNLDDCEAFIRKSAETLNKEGKEVDFMRFEFEKIARAYDPCISCATHLVKVFKK
ncbi:MAG TPA: Ni/Fe hydrogenase subunit alpha [Firmicutes bacterium]|nr:Ni/Fe hydrogenase subunit alpha [Bacillota bacterium]